MGSKRGNLVVAEQNSHRRTHYHDKSYHNRSDHFDARTSYRDESGNVAFYVYAGERSAAAQPRRDVSGAEIDRVVGHSHTQGLDSFWEGRLANVRVSGFVARVRHKAARLARMPL